MRFPIQHALFYPRREKTPFDGIDLTLLGKLEFEKPDTETFQCLKLAYEYGKRGFPYTALLVGADEGAVELFLEGKISFTEIPSVIKQTVERLAPHYTGVEKPRKVIPQMVKEAYRTAKELFLTNNPLDRSELDL
jgi:1-deoxy-D-xylulose-5-phosphate reductoisomerase